MEKLKNEASNTVSYVSSMRQLGWSPLVRAVAGIAGVFVLGLSRRVDGRARQAMDFIGISLGIRALVNRDLTQLVGTLLSPTIKLHREVELDAPSDEVGLFWSCIENYPRFMSFVRKMDTNSHGHLVWDVSGPGGIPVRWEAEITSWHPSDVISWQSVPGSLIFNSGRVRIRSTAYRKSTLIVELSYALRGGALGYALVHVLGFDPRDRIDHDLTTMKSLIETDWKQKADDQNLLLSG